MNSHVMNSRVEDDTVFTSSAVVHFRSIGSCVRAPQKYMRVFDAARYEIQKVGLLVGKMKEKVVDGSGVSWNVVDAAKCRALFAYEEAEEKKTKVVKRTEDVPSVDPILHTFECKETNEKGIKEVAVVDPNSGIQEWYGEEDVPDTPMPAHVPTKIQVNNARANKERAMVQEQESRVKFCGTLDLCYPMFVQHHLDRGDILQVKAWCPCGRGGQFWRKSVLGEDDNGKNLEECSNDRLDGLANIADHCRRNGGPKHAAAHAYLTFIYFRQQGLEAGLTNFGRQRIALSAYLTQDRFACKAESPTVKEGEGQVNQKPAAAACQLPVKKQTQINEKPAAVERDAEEQRPSKKIKIKSAAGDAKDPVIID
jgi:hypothetical protein